MKTLGNPKSRGWRKG